MGRPLRPTSTDGVFDILGKQWFLTPFPRRSLLYLVSQSLEQGRTTPILGMEKYFNEKIASKKLANVHTWTAPGKESKSTTHVGFDDDQITMMSVISLMKGKAF